LIGTAVLGSEIGWTEATACGAWSHVKIARRSAPNGSTAVSGRAKQIEPVMAAFKDAPKLVKVAFAAAPKVAGMWRGAVVAVLALAVVPERQAAEETSADATGVKAMGRQSASLLRKACYCTAASEPGFMERHRD
jgi:hypothetical protein